MSQNGREYWRSLEQLAGDPRVRAFSEREFPENASVAPEGITRRTMLTLLGASVSMAGLAACRRPVEKIVPYVNGPEDLIPGVPLYFATTMPTKNAKTNGLRKTERVDSRARAADGSVMLASRR